MKYRKLGKTGLNVSEVGYGAWGISNFMWVGANDDDSLKALHKSIDLGLNFIDTALGYGAGHSERLIGQVVRERSETVYVASKIPPKNLMWPSSGTAEEAFPSEHIIECTEQSLKNLGLEALDVQQFHVWSDEWIDQGDWLEGVRKLKEQGKIKSFGVSINDHQPENAIKLIESGLVDSVQVIFNVFEQKPLERLFPACEKNNVGVIVRVPLDEGGLTGRIKPESTFAEDDFRNNYFQGDRKRQVYEKVQDMAADLNVTVEDIPQIALRFILSQPAVSTTIPGMRSIRNVEKNCSLSELGPLSNEQLNILKKYRWDKNFYQAD
ncbi:aldo/keto reductase [Chengkuizengella axinellae]|uniref:Aldo/keto reductase n=1 Tax=Chengkuizengella axinellae TaxID=3064388 RepID=A0ABT9J6Z5_9BACL|nr:aldo/keto reductase [Chengkuizengella sp. 2205SS18-9]MDP5276795.1 aldo/keto reductase [Chengkuizengella sp. 2205SS18-9]